MRQGGGRLCHGEDFAAAARQVWAAAAAAKTTNLKAVGINCTHEQDIPPLLASLSSRDNIPLVIYPNSVDYGETADPQHLGRLAKKWMAIYPRVWAVGGCCGYHPKDIGGLRCSLKD